MTDNSELYSVIGKILKEFKAEVEETVEVALSVTSDYSKESSEAILKTQSALDDLTSLYDLSEKENKESVQAVSDLAKCAGQSILTQDVKYKEFVDLLTDSVEGLTTLTDRESMNALSSRTRDDELTKNNDALSIGFDKLKDSLAQYEADHADLSDVVGGTRDELKELKGISELNKEYTFTSSREITKIKESLTEEFKKEFESAFNIIAANKTEASERYTEAITMVDSKIDETVASKHKLVETEQELLTDRVNEKLNAIDIDVSEALASQSELISELKAELEQQKQDNVDLLAETKQYIDELVPSLKGETGSLDRVIEWHKDYPREINQIVTHNNCLWQLKYNDSNDAPSSESDDWRLLIAGMTGIKIETGNANVTEIVISDGSGKSFSNAITLPVPNMLGTWDAEEKYKFYDNVKKDGCRWITHKDNPEGEPGKSKDWFIDSLPAQRGRKGESGEKGERGITGLSGHTPTRQEIITVMNEDA